MYNHFFVVVLLSPGFLRRRYDVVRCTCASYPRANYCFFFRVHLVFSRLAFSKSTCIYNCTGLLSRNTGSVLREKTRFGASYSCFITIQT